MKAKSVNNFELETIKKYSKFILKFDNTAKFEEYIKENNFKIAGCVPKEDSKRLHCYQFDPLKWDKVERRIQKKWLIPETDKKTQCTAKLREGVLLRFHTIEVLPFFYYIAFFLFNEEKVIGMLPLNMLIRRLDNWKHFDSNKLFEEMEKDGRFFIYWNKSFMLYEDYDIDIETMTIKRKYEGHASNDKFDEMGDETRIIVVGSDNTKRTINKEAKDYFEKQGYKVEFTQKLFYNKEYPEGAIINFLENANVRKVLKKDDLIKIKKYASREQHFEIGFTGFPDLFVWNDKGDYFFVEVKSQKDKVHRSQLEWIRWNEKVGKFKFKILNILNTD